MNEIESILKAAAAIGIRNELKDLAISLMKEYSSWLSRTYPNQNYIITDHIEFYNLAYRLMVETEEEVTPQRRDVSPHHDEDNVFGSYEEFYDRTSMIALEISEKDFADNNLQIKTGQSLFQTIFILTDIWSLFTYYELIYSLELYESPKLVLHFDNTTTLNTLPTDANIYIIGWHPTEHSNTVVDMLIKRGHKIQDITKIETVGIDTMTPCQTIPIFRSKDPDVYGFGYGLGRPDSNGKNSEMLSLFYKPI